MNAGAALSGAAAFQHKIDLYMRLHVISKFDAERIHWWFSLSGGKDSFAMTEGIREWYRSNRLKFTSGILTVDQWGDAAANSIKSQLPGQKVHVLDGRELTQLATNYVVGNQAPCRACSDVRRQLTDKLLDQNEPRTGFVNFIARGLHLSDTANSLIWRFALGRDPSAEMILNGKAKPIAKLSQVTYLVKPLTYIREFESEEYAKTRGFRPSCCGCPACKFPSRRDIVEESLRNFYRGERWEFDVPGMQELLTHFGGSDAFEFSAPGIHAKHNHLPADFSDFAVNHFRQIIEKSKVDWTALCDSTVDLDHIGASRMQEGTNRVPLPVVPLPALLQNRSLSVLEKSMIATMGPFWGAIGLDTRSAERAWRLQDEHFKIMVSDRWTQVTPLLRSYYSYKELKSSPNVLKFYPVKSIGRGRNECLVGGK